MSNKQQTAVEWLMNELTKLGSGAVRTFGELFEQAKEMEKEQMFEFWNKGIDCTEEGGKSFEHYYNETYKTGKP
jgi:hypothetical protein